MAAETNTSSVTSKSFLKINTWMNLIQNNNTFFIMSPDLFSASITRHTESDAERLRKSGNKGAGLFVATVVMFYALSAVMLIVLRARKNRAKLLEDKEIHKYLQEFQTVKERSRQDSYRHLKRSVIARLGLARLPKTSATTLGQALVPAVALALPSCNLRHLRGSPFFDRSLTASQRSSLVPDDFRLPRHRFSLCVDDARFLTVKPRASFSADVGINLANSRQNSGLLRPDATIAQTRADSYLELLSERDEMEFVDEIATTEATNGFIHKKTNNDRAKPLIQSSKSAFRPNNLPLLTITGTDVTDGDDPTFKTVVSKNKNLSKTDVGSSFMNLTNGTTSIKMFATDGSSMHASSTTSPEKEVEEKLYESYYYNMPTLMRNKTISFSGECERLFSQSVTCQHAPCTKLSPLNSSLNSSGYHSLINFSLKNASVDDKTKGSVSYKSIQASDSNPPLVWCQRKPITNVSTPSAVTQHQSSVSLRRTPSPIQSIIEKCSSPGVDNLKDDSNYKEMYAAPNDHGYPVTFDQLTSI